MDTGGRCVIICGQQLMPMWPVDNLAILARVSDNTTFILLHESRLLFVFLQTQLLLAVHILDRTQISL